MARGGAGEASVASHRGQPNRAEYAALPQDTEEDSPDATPEPPPKGLRQAVLRTACAVLGLAALASVAWAARFEIQQGRAFAASRQDGRALCGVTQENVEFFQEASTTRATFVTGADACREECETGRHCVAWTWGASVGCLLKAGGEPQLGGGPPARGLLQLPAVPRPGVVSGVSCAASEHSTGIRWSIDGVAAGREPGPVVSAGRELRRELIVDPGVTRPTSTSRPANATDANAPAAAANGTSATTATTSTTSTRTTTFPPGSLLCFSLMVPNSYEQDLLLMQHYIGASIFGCEEAAIYSNMVINLAPGLQTRFVDSDLHCNSGGEFQTALNTEIFLAVWKKLLSDQRYALHDWTVKVDPDCVFLPSLLRHMLREYQHLASVSTGVYLNNCKYGMHGPLEVLSVNAVATWGAGIHRCIEHFEKMCSGTCLWGEDMFIDQCLSTVLHVRRIDEFRLLTEDHCDPPAGWHSCTNRTQVAFHPFKTLRSYQQCLSSTSAVDYMDQTRLHRSLQMFEY